jgi:Rad3-related DNA helicase
VALTYRSSDAVLKLWLARIDNIIRRRLDRKGIIHCVSYARRDLIIRNSRYKDLMLTHDSGEQAVAVEKFKSADPPRIFLSPSATTGLDFPYDQCEYSIVAKVPFPDQRSKILKARAKGDPEYAMYLTMLDVVQASGRGMRAVDDSHETFIVDDQWGWFHKKFRRFAPAWFLESCRRTESIPNPPPKLRTNG